MERNFKAELYPLMFMMSHGHHMTALMKSDITGPFNDPVLQVYKILVMRGQWDSWVIFRHYSDFCRLKDKVKVMSEGPGQVKMSEINISRHH